MTIDEMNSQLALLIASLQFLMEDRMNYSEFDEAIETAKSLGETVMKLQAENANLTKENNNLFAQNAWHLAAINDLSKSKNELFLENEELHKEIDRLGELKKPLFPFYYLKKKRSCNK